MKTSTSIAMIAATLALGACKGRDSETSAETLDLFAEPKKVSRPAIQTQKLPAPCSWLTPQEVAETFEALAAEPYRVSDAENLSPDGIGEACVYPVATERGVANVAVQVDPRGAPALESATEIIAPVIAREMPQELQGEAPRAEKKADDGWDVSEWVAGERLYRMGHVAIRVGDRASVMQEKTLDRLALRLRGKMADKPFVTEGSDPNAAGYAPDPCELLKRAEAESVLGPLAAEPYRSLKWSALADGNGPSCTYYTAGHRAFVLHPSYVDGKEEFAILAGFGGLMRSNAGGADAGDLLDGPWDAATAGPIGDLVLVSGDTLLRVVYRTSATDIEGAAKLAAIAMPQLAAE